MFKFDVWYRGGQDGDDKFDLGYAYGRVIFDSEDKRYVTPHDTLIVECIVVNGGRRIDNPDQIRRTMPALPISADWDREKLTLTAESFRFSEAKPIEPRNDHQADILRMADVLGVVIESIPGCSNGFRLFLPNLEDAQTLYGTTSVYKFISHLPVTVDTAAFVQRSQDVSNMIKAKTLVEQAPAMHRLNDEGNQWPRELDHLIYDGMAQVASDGRQIGSVRP